MAEQPAGRKQLQHTGPVLQRMALGGDGSTPEVMRHADLALRSLGWVAAGITV